MLIQDLVLSLKKNKIYIAYIMGVQRKYNQNLGEYEYYDAFTETRIEYNPLTEGSRFFFFIFSNIGSRLATEGVKKSSIKSSRCGIRVRNETSWRKSRRICTSQDFSQKNQWGR